MKILLSAFACDPNFGSDEEVGWRWALGLAAMGHEVWVLTRTSHQNSIEDYQNKNGKLTSINFIYIDIDRLHRILSKVNRRNHIYYYFWQIAAFKRAKKLISEINLDYIHHVTWVSFRQPSFMGFLGVPFLFGPVAGGDEIPAGYMQGFSLKQKTVEYVRRLANLLVRFDPLMLLTFKKAEKILFTSEYHLHRVPKWVARKASVELAIGCDEVSPHFIQSGIKNNKRLLFVGRCIGWKGMDLGLKIFARSLQLDPQLKLTIIGDGVDRDRWMNKAVGLGIDHAIEWKGWLPKNEVVKLYSEYDLLFYPSLRDSGGFVVLEALQKGLPVVCFKLGGPGVVVNDCCGKAVPAMNNRTDEACELFGQAVISTLLRSEHDLTLSDKCRARAQEFSWSQLLSRIVENNIRGRL